MKTKRLLILALLSSVLSAPVGGFIFGFLNCENCTFNIFGRVLIGIIYAILTPLFGGFPIMDEGGTGKFNVWPYIGIAFVLVFFLFVFCDRRKQSSEGIKEEANKLPRAANGTSDDPKAYKQTKT
jgi:hypothetical protein